MKDSVKLDRFVVKLDKLCKQYGVRIHARTDPKDGLPIAVAEIFGNSPFDDARNVEQGILGYEYGDKVGTYGR